MPPSPLPARLERSISAVKPVKSERSHEENQERAYIAASRRSDRSLEARVESARRASEIHKRRTGRALRVTEQDVINEEMYEEEDDDLPNQYRRLTAHLHTNSVDFNRRLAQYLATHVAMRNALGKAISSSYQPQYAGQSGQALLNGDPSQPLLPFEAKLQQGQHEEQQLQQQMLQQKQQQPSPPYSPPTFAFPNAPMSATHHLPRPAAAAPAVPHFSPTFDQSQLHIPEAKTGEKRRSTASLDRPSTKRMATGTSDSSRHSTSPTLPTQDSTGFGRQFSQPSFYTPQQQTPSPFSTVLPLETQMFLNPAYGVKPQYTYNPNGFDKPSTMRTPYDGMSQTLAPGALDTKLDALNWTSPTQTPTSTVEPSTTSSIFTAAPYIDPSYSSAFDQEFDAGGYGLFNNDPSLGDDDSWTNFIDPSHFEDSVS